MQKKKLNAAGALFWKHAREVVGHRYRLFDNNGIDSISYGIASTHNQTDVHKLEVVFRTIPSFGI